MLARARKLILKMSFVALLLQGGKSVHSLFRPAGRMAISAVLVSLGARLTRMACLRSRVLGPLLEAMPTDSTLSICRSRVTEQSLRA